tara:strand:- start:855 stop:1562 length:708 start_codon:yes stop_codon:yes gene_type:complete
MKNLLLIFFTLIISSSCYNNKGKEFLKSRQSFVKIEAYHNTKICDSKECIQINNDSLASGVVVGDGTRKLVLTAGHSCIAKTIENVDKNKLKIVITSRLVALDLGGTRHKLEIVKVDPEKDMCLLKFVKTNQLRPLRMAEVAPSVGDSVINFAAPGGIFEPGMVPILKGVYSGQVKSGASAYTIPAMPGSSGSPIVASNGHLIGMIHSVHTEFNNFSLSPSYNDIKDFLKRDILK